VTRGGVKLDAGEEEGLEKALLEAMAGNAR
jgi:hypothetical protein